DVADGVVSEVAHCAADEARKAGKRYRVARAREVGELRNGICGPMRLTPSGLRRPAARRSVRVQAPCGVRLGTQEGVACPGLAALDGLEQEAEGRARELRVRADGGIRIEQDFATYRNEPAVAGMAQKRRTIRDEHRRGNVEQPRKRVNH